MTREGTRRLAAVWFADIVGYTARSARDEDLGLRVVRELQRLARLQCDARGGRVVKLLGDAVLAVFDSADGAVRAAIGLRDAFLQSPEAKAAGVSLRVGLHLGDVAEAVDGDVHGDAVNAASRIQAMAQPGQVVISGIAYQLLQQRSALQLEDLGEQDLKGLGPVRLYAASLSGASEAVDLRELLQAELAPLQLLDAAGLGGMGEIYLARDPRLHRTLAVKVLRSELVADKQALARFQREAQVIAGLSHPNVITIHTVGELEDGTPYFVMDYVEGGSLADRLTSDGPLPVPEAKRIMGEVASALQAAHAKGIIHRDVKPGNVLWDLESGRTLVTDWGIAALDPTWDLGPEARLTKTGMFVGSPQYMSPEQLAGDEVGPETDVYSLGLLAYELLTGHGPFPAQTPRELMISHLTEEAPPLSNLRKEVDPELEAVIARCLAKSPADRPNAEEVARRFAPGAEAILEWPPPGLEGLMGRGPVFLAVFGTWVAMIAVPILLAYSARLPWGGRDVMQMLTSGSTATGTTLLLLALPLVLLLVLVARSTRAPGLLLIGRAGQVLKRRDPLKQALGLGYGWRTVLEVVDDRWGDGGNLIAGRREYAVVDAAERARIRRRRLRRMALRWAATLSLPFTLIFGAHLAAVGAVSILGGLLAGVALPLLFWLISLVPSEPQAVRITRARMAQTSQPPEALVSQVLAWGAALESAAGPSGPSQGHPTSERGWYAYNTAITALMAVLYLYFIAALFALLPGTSRADPPPDPREAVARISAVAAAASLRLPTDSTLSPEQAAGIVRRLVAPGPGALVWEGDRPGQETIPTSALLGSTLAPPYSLAPGQVMPVVLATPSPPEVAYLRGFGGDPRFPLFERLARASSYDPGLPDGYHEEMLFSERAGVRPLLPLQEVALHKVAFAGYLAATGQELAAELPLREVFSVGYLLAMESNELEVAMLGRNMAALAQGVLEQLSRMQSGSAKPTASESLQASSRHRLSRRDWLTRSLELVADPTVPRAVRLELVGVITSTDVCTSLDGILFGPDEEVLEAVDGARPGLVRYPSDAAHVDMAAYSLDRLIRRIDADPGREVGDRFRENEILGWTLRIGARLFRNPRFLACPVAMAME